MCKNIFICIYLLIMYAHVAIILNNIIKNELVNDVIVPSSINNAGSIEKYNSEELMSGRKY